MKRAWQVYMERIDAATLRERALIFAAAALLLIAVLNALLIEPELRKQRRLSREVVQRQGEIRELQAQVQKLTLLRQADPEKAQRERVEGLRKRLAATDTRLAEEQRKLAAPGQVSALLEEMLSRNRRLRLVDMRSLAAEPLANGQPAANGKPSPGKPAAGRPAAVKPGGAGQIYRHGVEITVAGNYLDLLAYLRDLERLPNQLYWGRLELDAATAAERAQVSLKLSVYTLSLDFAWLVV